MWREYVCDSLCEMGHTTPTSPISVGHINSLKPTLILTRELMWVLLLFSRHQIFSLNKVRATVIVFLGS